MIIATKMTAAISQSIMGRTLPVLGNAITSEVYAIAGEAALGPACP